MKRSLFTIGFILCCGFAIKAQQKAMYSQYMFNGLALNPAYSSTDDALTFTALSRHQWVGFAGAPNTQTFSVHSPVKESNTSLGAMIIRDQIGEVITQRGGYVTAAQRVALSGSTYLAVGFNGGVSFNNASFSDNYNASPNSVDDPVFQNVNYSSANFGFGVMLFSDKYYAGISSPHFYNHDFITPISNTKPVNRPHYIVQAGVIAPIGDELKFKPNFIVKYVNGSPVQFDLNANFLIKETVWLGASYRSLESFDAVMQVYIGQTVALGYSYDFATTALRQVQKGTHEIMLQYRIPGRGKNAPRCYF